MRKLFLFLSLLSLSLGVQPAAFAQASPYNLFVFKAQSFSDTGQTGTPIQLNGLTIPSTVGSSYASGTITVTGVALTTVSFQVMGSSDNGATYYLLPVYSVPSPSASPVTTVTATAAGLYQISLAGLTHIKLLTTGTFTATSVSLTLTGSPNASISKNGSGGGSISLTSPDGTINVGGTGAAPTIDLNLALANTWTQGMTIQDGLTLDTLAFTTDGEGMTFTNGSQIFEDPTFGLVLVGANTIQLVALSGNTGILGPDAANGINSFQILGGGVPAMALEVGTNNTEAFFASNRQTLKLNNANVSEAQIGSSVSSGTTIPAFTPTFAVGDHTIAVKGAVAYTPVGIISPGATVTLQTAALQTYTLNANTTASVPNIYYGEHTTIQVCQPSSGGPFTWTWPAAVIGGMPASTSASSCIQQVFDSFDGATLVASTQSQTVTPSLNVAAALPHWIACTAKVKTNQGNCRVYAVGDSTTAGAYALNTGDTGDVFAASYPTWLSKYLNSAVFPSQRGAFCGDGAGSQAIVSVNDARVSIGSWFQGDLNSTGGLMFKATATGAPMTFTPTDQVDTFRIWYITSPAPLGTFTYQIDSGTPVSVSESGTASLQSITTTAVALGSHTIKFNFVSGIGVFIVAVESYNSTLGSVQVANCGWVGATTTNWAAGAGGGNPWDPQNAVQTQAPDLILLSLGINDWNGGIPVATYKANLQSMVTAWLANSDVVLVSPAPSSIGSSPTLATQKQYVTAMAQVAAANNIPFIDNFNRWISYELKNPAPFLFYNHPFHPSQTGYSDFAQSIGSNLLSVIGPGTSPAVVLSFNTRKGAVIPTSGDYTAAQVTNALDLSATATQTMSGNLAIPVGSSIGAPIIRDATGVSAATLAVGRWTYGASGALSLPTALYTGAPITGGTGTTTFPMFLMQPTGATAVTTWATTGTFLGINSTTGWSGNFLDIFNNGVHEFTVSAFGSANANHWGTITNCLSALSPAVCAAATMGSIAVPAGTNPTLVVNSSAVTAASEIFLTPDQSLGTRLSVTCNTTTPTASVITARTAGTSFTFQAVGTFTTNPECYNFAIYN